MKKLIFLFLALISVRSHAGGVTVGNGGDVLVCSRVEKKTVELLDHYEARELRKIPLQMGPASSPFREKVEFVLKRMEKLNPSRANLYREWLQDFETDTEFLVDKDIIPISDVGPGVIPTGCQLVQIAVHQNPQLPGDIRYQIRKDLWDLLDDTGKAGLILHELIYREIVNQGWTPTNSKFVRYFNAVVSSERIESMVLKDYIALVKMTGLRFADAQGGVPILLFPCTDDQCLESEVSYYNDRTIQYARFPESDKIAKAFHYDIARNYNILGALFSVVPNTNGHCGPDARVFAPNGWLCSGGFASADPVVLHLGATQVRIPPALPNSYSRGWFKYEEDKWTFGGSDFEILKDLRTTSCKALEIDPTSRTLKCKDVGSPIDWD